MGHNLAFDIGVVLAALVLGIVLLVVVVWIRRWLLERRSGTIECSLRVLSSGSGAWRLGIGRYEGARLLWYHVFGIRLRPRHVLHRRGHLIAKRRQPSGDEVAVLPPDAEIIELRDEELIVELGMSRLALTGFLAWLEAGPPGSPIDHIT